MFATRVVRRALTCWISLTAGSWRLMSSSSSCAPYEGASSSFGRIATAVPGVRSLHAGVHLPLPLMTFGSLLPLTGVVEAVRGGAGFDDGAVEREPVDDCRTQARVSEGLRPPA